MKKIFTLLLISMSFWVSAQCPTATANLYYVTICSREITGISLTSNISGTTFSWTCVSTGVTGAGNGSGNSIFQTLSASGSSIGHVVYTVTPRANGCNGNPIDVTVNVNPVPLVNVTPSSVICSEESTAIMFSSNVPGTIFSWTVAQTDVTGASNGTGNTINQILTTTGSSRGDVIYTITPSNNGCVGNPTSILVRVNPLPTAVLSDGTICVDQGTGTAFTSYIFDTGLSNSGYDFVWYYNASLIPGATNNTYEAIQSGNYCVVIINTLTGCISSTICANVYASYPAEISATGPLAILSGESSNIFITSSMPANTISDWTVSQNGVTGASDGTGNSIEQILTTTGVFPGTAEYSVHTTDINGCTDETDIISIIVLYVPGLSNGIIGTDGSGNVTQPYLLDTGLSDSRYTCEWTLDGVAFRGNNGVNGITTNQFSATQAGHYCVVATNILTGFRSLEACADVTTQVLSNNQFNTIQLTYSPNPVTDVLAIQSKELLKKVTVYNTLGQKVYSNILNDLNPKIDLSSLVSGNYFIKVETENKQNVIQIVKK